MVKREKKYDLNVDNTLLKFINLEVLPGTGIEEEVFWKGFSDLIVEFQKKNKGLLEKRETIQNTIDKWHINNKDKLDDIDVYKIFLNDIGYLHQEGKPFAINTQNVDPEIAKVSGPQLVVPIMNARYALNAANARWGSLYDALYGTDAMGDLPFKKEYEEKRGEKVILFAKSHLDKAVPLVSHKWKNINNISIVNNKINIFIDSKNINLQDIDQFIGHIKNDEGEVRQLLFKKNGLRLKIIIDPDNNIGSKDPANIADIILESALSTIMDCEDSVAAVDGNDKVLAYRNWLGLMKGDLTERVKKAEKVITRELNSDIVFIDTDGENRIIKGRSLMLNRNVGHLMTNPAIITSENEEVYEGLMDAMFSVLIAIHDLNKSSGLRNSIRKSVYIVKPKMHGPEEVSFANDVFTKVESILGLPKNTVKLGIMDEERRTSVNLMECIRAAKDRVAFINTGFLDRTGDEIHTSMEAGPFLKKGDMKSTSWIKSYEDRNVDIGLACGLKNKAQIGKGMWAMPDLMNAMLDQKIVHPKSGANCAWVPSPTAATLHAMHYHLVDVADVQENLIKEGRRGKLNDLLSIPVAKGQNWSEEEIKNEIENNSQGILGYVVRWVDQGVGCSKVPDINNIGLMEDRATCRISAQALANWLHHNIISKEDVINAMKKMAIVVDKQNINDKNYSPMSPSFDTIAFNAACDLVLQGRKQPSGYTEPVLHKRRLEWKNKNIN